MAERIVAMLPTYNESANIVELIEAILALGAEYETLVVDDDSPDGTWRLVEALAARHAGRVHLVRRVGERGRGSAGVRGFQEALRLGADRIVEMDADWSHHPRFIPALVAATQGDGGADVAIGSRLVPGGGEVGRSAVRRWITLGANCYIRTVLSLTPRDCTSGFRVFRRGALERADLAALHSNGPAIVQEVLLACRRAGCRFSEVPILFEERRAGVSTFNWRILLAGLWAVLRFRLSLTSRRRSG